MKKNLLLFFCLIYISAYSQGIKLNGPVSAENNPISNVSDPTKDQDAATKSYVDSNVNNSSINSLLDQINANIQIIDGKIVNVQTSAEDNNAAILDLSGAIAIVDGKIVAVDGKLDNVLANLTGQLADMILDINAQFSSVTVKVDGIDAISTSIDDNGSIIVSNQAEALAWYLNTMAAIGRVEVDLVSIDDQNAQILQQLAGMLTVIEAGFTGMDTGFQNQSDELTAAQAAILAEVTIAQNGIAANLIEIQNLETLVGILQSTIDDNQDLIEQNGLDILANGLLIDRNNGNILLNGNAIGVNGGLINDNAARIDANGDAIDANGDGIDEISTYIESNQAAELVWYLNTMNGIGRLEVDIANNGAEIVAAQTAIIAEIMSVQQQSIANLLEISEIQQTQATILMYLNSLEASIQALQADVTTLLGD
jgi:hypothetical protein